MRMKIMKKQEDEEKIPGVGPTLVASEVDQ